MLKHVHSIVAALARRFRSRAVVELENLALRHQLHVLRRQRTGRLRLITIDRLPWVWLYLSLLEIPSEPQFEQERALPMNWCEK
jgi:hypothetical protein